MYAHCLFCRTGLGANDTIEHLPVGRRVAFDGAQGRLWVVCRRCERWNLTPLEDRWEALEECERTYRGTPLRYATDEIGLARTTDGLELVRIGRPVLPEMAAWRYGDQFGRRRRRVITSTALMMVPLGLAFASSSLSALGIASNLLYHGVTWWQIHDATRRKVAVVPTAQGRRGITRQQVGGARFLHQPDGQWAMAIPVPNGLEPKGPTLPPLLVPPASVPSALRTMLPVLNAGGGSRKVVRGAVEVAVASRSIEQLVAEYLSNRAVGRDRLTYQAAGEIPAELRLGMELIAHEEQERRWLGGELLELERAWREAEALAKIADSLAVPGEIDKALARLRGANPSREPAAAEPRKPEIR